MLRPEPCVSVLRLSGAIGGGGRLSRGLDDARLAEQIERAFEAKRLKAVALAINSPGGSPAQSSLIARRIRDLASEKDVPVLAFCEDVAASGGYMLACAADEIYLDENSIVGSIGVISASFGFDQAIERVGVTRRLQTAGDRKSRLDPFLPEKSEDRAWLQGLQEKLHANFIEFVRQSRGARLGNPPGADLFSGEVWVGEDAVQTGLADGIARLRPFLRERYGERVRFNVIEPRRSFWERFGGGLRRDGLAEDLIDGALEKLETRALWARFGL
ncbi:MAG: S49 family peptidase [Pseudomonadota bacterium]